MQNSLETWQQLILILFGVLNFYTFILYYVDKKRAIHRKRRIPEKRLLIATFLFGGIGATLAMSIFRHKTKTLKFKLSVPLALILTTISIWFVFQF